MKQNPCLSAVIQPPPPPPYPPPTQPLTPPPPPHSVYNRPQFYYLGVHPTVARHHPLQAFRLLATPLPRFITTFYSFLISAKRTYSFYMINSIDSNPEHTFTGLNEFSDPS